MTWASLPPMFAAGAVLAGAGYHFIAHARRPGERVHLTFACLCLTVGLYDLACAGLYSAASPVEGVGWQHLQTVSLTVGGLAMLIFVSAYTDRVSRWVVAVFCLLALPILAVAPFGFGNLIWSDSPLVKRVEAPFGLDVTYQEMAPGPLQTLTGVVTWALFLTVIGAVVRLWRVSGPRRAAPLLAGLVLFFLGVLSDSAVAMGLYTSFYVIEYAFLALLVPMAYVLADEALRAAAAEQALLESEERYRILVEASPSAIVLLEADATIRFANAAAVSIVGAGSAGDLQGRPLSDFVPEEGWPRLAERLSGILEGTMPKRLVEEQLMRLDGAVIDVAVAGARVVHEGRPAVLGVGTDITERRLARQEREGLEVQLRHAQKMEAVGRLAGGVAHDFNNLLQAILSHTDSLSLDVGNPARMAEGLTDLQEQARRGAQLTRQLLLFSRRESTRPTLFDLNSVVGDTIDMVRRLLPENITLELALSGQPLPIQGDRGQIEQVVMNLALNGADAMPVGGRLTLRTTGFGASRVCLEVQDTGEGIPDEIREQIFEPFFTTKGAAEGSGLGLSVVHGIVAAHEGEIDLVTGYGEGTTFRVVLPKADSIASVEEPARQGQRAGEPPQARGERVLLVEDEPATRDGLRTILETLGYAVVAVATGEEARTLEPAPVFDLLLTDFLLPDCRGHELAAELELRWPGLRVILMSGYTRDAAVRDEVSAGSVHFLHKPFDLLTLANEVRSTLDEGTE